MDIDIGKGIRVNIDVARIVRQESTLHYCIKRALKDALQDSHASVTRDSCESDLDCREKSMAIAMKKLDTFYNGEIRANQSGPRVSSIDPIAAEALREARVFVHTKAKGWEKATDSAINWLTTIADKLGIELAEENPDWKAVIAAAVKFRAEKPESIATATKIVEARKAIAVDVDL